MTKRFNELYEKAKAQPRLIEKVIAKQIKNVPPLPEGWEYVPEYDKRFNFDKQSWEYVVTMIPRQKMGAEPVNFTADDFTEDLEKSFEAIWKDYHNSLLVSSRPLPNAKGVARHFYDLGRHSGEKSSEDLEDVYADEVIDWMGKYRPDLRDVIRATAYHFLQLGVKWGAEQFAKVVRANLSEIGKDAQYQFEQLYFEITGTKMYGGYND